LTTTAGHLREISATQQAELVDCQRFIAEEQQAKQVSQGQFAIGAHNAAVELDTFGQHVLRQARRYQTRVACINQVKAVAARSVDSAHGQLLLAALAEGVTELVGENSLDKQVLFLLVTARLVVLSEATALRYGAAVDPEAFKVGHTLHCVDGVFLYGERWLGQVSGRGRRRLGKLGLLVGEYWRVEVVAGSVVEVVSVGGLWTGGGLLESGGDDRVGELLLDLSDFGLVGSDSLAGLVQVKAGEVKRWNRAGVGDCRSVGSRERGRRLVMLLKVVGIVSGESVVVGWSLLWLG